MESTNRIMKKILILGPTKAGKTTLASFLGEYMGDEIRNEHENGEKMSQKLELEFNEVYRPTKGVRIVEFESHEFFPKNEEENRKNRMMNVDIQLWDVSGDKKYEDCWPAIKEGVNGVILVANPEEHTGSDLVSWYNEFVEKQHLGADNVMVLLNEQGPKKTNHELVSAFKIEPQLRGVSHVACHFGTEGLSLKSEVNNFLVKIMLQDKSTNISTEGHLAQIEAISDGEDEQEPEDLDDF